VLNFEIHHNDVILHLICWTSVRSKLTSFLGCSFIYHDYMNCAEGLAHLCFSLQIKVAVRKFHALSASRWFPHRCSQGCQYIVHGCKMKQAAASWVALCNWSSIPKQTSRNHSLSSLSATRWFK